MKTLMLALSLVAASPGQSRLFDDEAKPPVPAVQSTVAEPSASVAAPATRDDINSLAEKIRGILAPMEDRLASVERKTDEVTRDLAAMRTRHNQTDEAIKDVRGKLASVQAARPAEVKAASGPSPQKPATEATKAAAPQRYQLKDCNGEFCYGYDPAELTDRVARRNAWFAERQTRLGPVRYETAPAYAAYTPAAAYPAVQWQSAMPTEFYGGASYGGSVGCAPGTSCGAGFR